MRRSLMELYFPCARRKRFDTPLTSTAISLICSEFLGEVAFEAAEDGECHQEEDDAEQQHSAVESGVPGHAVQRERSEWLTSDGVADVHLRVQGALEGEDERRQRVEEVDPGDVVFRQLGRDRVLERVHD